MTAMPVSQTSLRAYLPLIVVFLGVGAAVAAYPLTAVGIPLAMLALASALFFFRDPVGVLLGFFVFEVIQLPLAAVLGFSRTPGHAVLHADEVMSFVLLGLAITLRWAHPTGVRFARYVAAGIVFACAGLLSAYHEHVLIPVAAVGCWLQLKWWVLLAAALLIPWSHRDTTRVLKVLVWIGLLLSILGGVDLVAQHPFRAFLHTNTVSLTFDPRASHAVESLFTTPAQFSIVMAMLMAVALAARIATRQARYGWYAVLFAAMALLSLRVSGLVAVVVAGFAVWMLGTRSFGSRALAFLTVTVGLVILFMLFRSEITSHISYYSSSSTNARSQLYSTSHLIADQNAPFGSGFGTFASAESRLHYSQLYRQYGLETVYGLSRQHPQFIDDTMWPAILGETGYAGVIAVAAGLLGLGVALLRRIRATTGTDVLFPLAAFGVLLVAVVTSAANPVMFNGLNSIMFALVAAPALVFTEKTSRELEVGPESALQFPLPRALALDAITPDHD